MGTVTPRWLRISMFVFAVTWAGLGIWALADGDYTKGAFDLALGVAWILMAFFRDRLRARYMAARK